MSATGRGVEREKDDFYRTPAWCVRALLPHLTRRPTILDPCCGDGAILDVVQRVWACGTRGVELDAARAATANAAGHSVSCTDALANAWPDADAIITNPPYRLAVDFISRAMPWARDKDVAFLLRINFLGAQKRSAFHRGYPADVMVLPRRPSFAQSISCAGRVVEGERKRRKCGWSVLLPLEVDWPRTCPQCGAETDRTTSDATEYAWFVWGPNRGGRWWMLECEPSARTVTEHPRQMRLA